MKCPIGVGMLPAGPSSCQSSPRLNLENSSKRVCSMEYLKIAFLILVAIVVLLYLRLSSFVSKSDRVLEIWSQIEQTPFLGAFVGRIFTMMFKIRNPFSRSIGIFVIECADGFRLSNYFS
jgi:hypothetical protein